MYLATSHIPTTSYQLRQSVAKAKNRFRSIQVFDLGQHPADHFVVHDERVVIFSDELLAAVEPHSPGRADSLLEKLLRPFFPQQFRHRTAPFHNRQNDRVTPISEEERLAISVQVHEFDRRRLYFLRYGAVDQSRLFRMHEKCCRPLLNQSRDEREHYFAKEERSIEPGDYIRYLYASLQLQRFFKEGFATTFPEALDRDQLADHFVARLCHLNEDASFWQFDDKTAQSSFLHPHLVRYLIMFFDYQPTTRNFGETFTRRFMGDHRRFRWPEKQKKQSEKKIVELFGHPLQDLKKMEKNQLSRLYRRRAKELHPDLGGDPSLFIELTELYQTLLR